VVAGYRTFVTGLLSVTDNRIDGRIEPPSDVVRYDGGDPYLVVAADKGTAAFSDLVNEIALEQGFWLGDAFASGGSVGYDHKSDGDYGARRLESVRRHFRELRLDPEIDEFTAVGIGDMSGDVFGNGMLLSDRSGSWRPSIIGTSFSTPILCCVTTSRRISPSASSVRRRRTLWRCTAASCTTWRSTAASTARSRLSLMTRSWTSAQRLAAD
jgi:hypothetical protein